MGHTVKIKDDQMEGYYCKMDAGFIISRSLLISVMPDMNKCISGKYSGTNRDPPIIFDDRNHGRTSR